MMSRNESNSWKRETGNLFEYAQRPEAEGTEQLAERGKRSIICGCFLAVSPSFVSPDR
jgi:hypothetical protein